MNSQLTTLNTFKTGFVVERTKDLNFFKTITGNRDVDPRHVEKIQASMKEETLFAPLYLNDEHEVIDGQHRLAAKRKSLEEDDVLLGDGVEYIIFKGQHYGAEDLAMYNSSSRVWSSHSFFSSYLELGNPNYVLANEFVKYARETADLPLATSLDILGGWRAVEGNKLGTLTVSKEQVEKGMELVSRLLDFREAGFAFYKLLTFVQAFKAMSNKPGYKHERMKTKMITNKEMLIYRTKKLDYLADLQDMYQ